MNDNRMRKPLLAMTFDESLTGGDFAARNAGLIPSDFHIHAMCIASLRPVVIVGEQDYRVEKKGVLPRSM